MQVIIQLIEFGDFADFLIELLLDFTGHFLAME